MRKDAAAELDEIDKHIDDMQAGINYLVRDCPGVLRLQAERDGTTYIVTICGSPTTPEGGIQEVSNVHRTREP